MGIKSQDKRIGLQIEASQRILGAIGPFIMEFTRTELMLYKVLLRYVGVTDAVGRSIFDGVRADRMVDLLKAIIKNRGIGIRRAKDLEAIFPQFGSISTMRNFLVHQRIGGFSTTGTIVSSRERAKNLSALSSHFVTYEMLQAMTADLSQVELRLTFHCRKGAFHPCPQGMRSPWLYKSPPTLDKPGKTHRAGQRRPVQHLSSRKRP